MKKTNQKGFTLIEMMMVIMLVAILAAVAIPQFVDFRTDAKNAAVNSSLGALRTALAVQTGQMLLRCSAPSGTYPTNAQFTGNDITIGASPCTAAMVPVVAERAFVPNQLPDNPWSGSTAASKRVVAACGGATGCARSGTNCAGAAYSSADGGWCYDASKGTVWANSNNNGSATAQDYTF